ncbi:peptidylprolyl isomerase [Flammeovirga yaeyamensis]|uniref:peptidylprolyl isomerase n=1 Tax=Flammeovirga yaeyamensis TaxID=367791 RepID=A0AAX1N4I4_9BACT|nr:peptidylprolyl isomerase [Flammeovirga yaeyamensis]MBB3700348.1 cyclophilin family peptidyl-prolyl cis-trans isomerase [Flammeovirga yaeyamensis]NMF37026.1 peptidylprolyl isomerase [Flammeovirga yaeyamensis]QWG02431.1 peptidylprolyl isomerase [Flammeovirga yaeyamensis]
MNIEKNTKKKLINYLLIISGLTLFLAGCKNGGDGDWERNKKVEVEPTSEDLDFLVTITTDYGDMKAVLFKDTPLHRENFVTLVKQHYYDSLLFHRVMKNFMIQGGDPDSRFADDEEDLGRGEIGYTIDSEIMKTHYHRKGALAMARKGDDVNPERASSGCQFYIVDGRGWNKDDLIDSRIDHLKLYKYFEMMIQEPEYKKITTAYQTMGSNGDQQGQKRLMRKCIPMVEKKYEVSLINRLSSKQLEAYTTVGGAPFLDEKYTVFGQVVEGLEVIDKIATQKVNRRNRPLENIKMSITIEEVPKTQTKNYLKQMGL